MLVAGSGRSGTSLMASILRTLGLLVPPPEVPADPSNPKGFAESQWVVDFHAGLMSRLHIQMSDARPRALVDALEAQVDSDVRKRLSGWLDERRDDVDLVIKDPRLLWFLSLWIDVGTGAGYRPGTVTMLRHPAEVLASKTRWYSSRVNDAHRAAGWVNTMLATERSTRDLPRCFIKYEDLVDDWTTEVERLANALGIEYLLQVPATRQIESASLVDLSLKRSSNSWDAFNVPKSVVTLAESTWSLLEDLRADPDSASLRADLDSVRSEYDELYEEAEAIASSSVIAARVESPSSSSSRSTLAKPKRNVPWSRRLAWKIPHGVRAMIPAGVRKKVMKPVDALSKAGDS